jgi:hypothetical protein
MLLWPAISAGLRLLRPARLSPAAE